MKRTLIIIVLALLNIATPAQDYKGFHTLLDFYAGYSSKKDNSKFSAESFAVKSLQMPLTFGLNVSEGYQVLPNLFAGIGFGGYAVFANYKYDYSGNDNYSDEMSGRFIYFPFYVNARYTLNRNATVTPFADVKFGYQVGINLDAGDCMWEEKNNVFLSHRNSVYFVPTVGIRFGRAVGFNLGISYNPSVKMDITYFKDCQMISRKKFTSGAFSLILGLDF